jgi:hypothetical protein
MTMPKSEHTPGQRLRETLNYYERLDRSYYRPVRGFWLRRCPNCGSRIVRWIAAPRCLGRRFWWPVHYRCVGPIRTQRGDQSR